MAGTYQPGAPPENRIPRLRSFHAKSRTGSSVVMPANAGIQAGWRHGRALDSRVRGNDRLPHGAFEAKPPDGEGTLLHPLLSGEGWGEVMKCPRSTLLHLSTYS